MKRGYLAKRITAAALSVALLAGAAVGVSFAYYTDTSQANGSVPFTVGTPDTDLTEDIVGMNKNITVENTGDVAVMVRVKVNYPSAEFAAVSIGDESPNWSSSMGIKSGCTTTSRWRRVRLPMCSRCSSRPRIRRQRALTSP